MSRKGVCKGYLWCRTLCFLYISSSSVLSFVHTSTPTPTPTHTASEKSFCYERLLLLHHPSPGHLHHRGLIFFPTASLPNLPFLPPLWLRPPFPIPRTSHKVLIDPMDEPSPPNRSPQGIQRGGDWWSPESSSIRSRRTGRSRRWGRCQRRRGGDEQGRVGFGSKGSRQEQEKDWWGGGRVR